jgi:outer membrane biosynthesis protein TonB
MEKFQIETINKMLEDKQFMNSLPAKFPGFISITLDDELIITISEDYDTKSFDLFYDDIEIPYTIKKQKQKAVVATTEEPKVQESDEQIMPEQTPKTYEEEKDQGNPVVMVPSQNGAVPTTPTEPNLMQTPEEFYKSQMTPEQYEAWKKRTGVK